MVKAKAPQLPVDLPTLSRWLALDPKPHVAALAAWLEKADETSWPHTFLRARLALAWAWDAEPEVFFPLVSSWLKGTNVRLRRVATAALPVSHEAHREKCLKLLKKLSQDKDRQVRLIAMDFLTEDAEHNLDLIKKLAATPDPEVRSVLARHLQEIHPDSIKKAVPILELLGQDPDPKVHWAVASSLREIYDREARPALDVARQMAVSEDEGVRWAIAGGFFEHVFADNFDQLLPTIRSWLRQGDPNVRWTLVRALRFIKVNARSLQLLRALYEDSDPEIRRRVVQQLLDLFNPRGGDAYRSVGELLRRAKRDGAKRVREVVEEGESQLGIDFDTVPLPGEDVPDELDQDGEGEDEDEE
jgi:HEAT repeat protein